MPTEVQFWWNMGESANLYSTWCQLEQFTWARRPNCKMTPSYDWQFDVLVIELLHGAASLGFFTAWGLVFKSKYPRDTTGSDQFHKGWTQKLALHHFHHVLLAKK